MPSESLPRRSFVNFAYDNRGRLIAESRVVDGTTTVYDLSYTYDQLGNRLTKFDAVSLLRTDYSYDVHVDAGEMGDYVTHHNRLLYYQVYDTSETPEVLLRTVKYTYYKTGQASNIAVIDEGVGPEYDWAQDLALYYYSHGDLHQALWGKYELDANGDPVSGTYETLGMREFRYNGPRARYLAMNYDTYGSDAPADWEPAYPATWTISDGVLPYGDREIAGPTATPGDVMRYLATAAQQPLAGNGVPTDTLFLHGDLIGSTNLLTDGAGNPAATLAYTAFGETIGDPSALGTRYQYVGRHAYESDLLGLDGVNPSLPVITLQHVGYRWYEPGIGRFVQRDPIGIDAGLNVYAYLSNSPTTGVDPDGLAVDPVTWAAIAVLIAGAITVHHIVSEVDLIEPDLWQETALTNAAKTDFNKNWRGPGPRRLPNLKGMTCIMYLPLNDGTGRASVMFRDSEGAKQFYTPPGIFPVEQGTYFPPP